MSSLSDAGACLGPTNLTPTWAEMFNQSDGIIARGPRGGNWAVNAESAKETGKKTAVHPAKSMICPAIWDSVTKGQGRRNWRMVVGDWR